MTKGTSWVVRHYPKINTTWLTAAILKIDMTSYFQGECSDLAIFGSRMQSDITITARWYRLKPEVEFQYGGRLYFETGSSYISAGNGDISTKFGLLIDFDFLNAVTSTKLLGDEIRNWK